MQLPNQASLNLGHKTQNRLECSCQYSMAIFRAAHFYHACHMTWKSLVNWLALQTSFVPLTNIKDHNNWYAKTEMQEEAKSQILLCIINETEESHTYPSHAGIRLSSSFFPKPTIADHDPLNQTQKQLLGFRVQPDSLHFGFKKWSPTTLAAGVQHEQTHAYMFSLQIHL